MSGQSLARKYARAQGDPRRQRSIAQEVARAYEKEGGTSEAARFWELAGEPLSAAFAYEQDPSTFNKASRCFLEAKWYGRAATMEERVGNLQVAVKLYELAHAYEDLARLSKESDPKKCGETLELFFGDFSGAAEAYASALEIEVSSDEGKIDCRFRLSHCLARTGKTKEAMDAYRQAITRLRTGGWMQDWLALAAYGVRAGREDLVVEGYETALTILEADSEVFEIVRLLESYLEAVRIFPNRGLIRGVQAQLRRQREDLTSQGVSVRVPARTNPRASVTMDKLPYGMTVIPTGMYWTGDEGDERFPRQKVELQAFAVDVFPVTNADYLRFVQATGHRFPLDENNLGVWRHGRVPEDKFRHPVVHVAWEDALAYARWAGKRLLTSFEWEVASAGENGSRYPWGDRFLPARCNVVVPGGPRRPGGTIPVDTFPQGCSSFGVADMAGNVWEWVFDWFDPSLSLKLLRGGCWASSEPESQLRSAYKTGLAPHTRWPTVGFRCALSVTGPVPNGTRKRYFSMDA